MSLHANGNGPLDEVESQVRAMNLDFYAAAPGDYFEIRLQSLLLLGGRAADVVSLFQEGVSYGGVDYTFGDGAEVDQDGLIQYVTMESQVLLHHTIETLLRLHLVHADLPLCPPIAISEERNFRRFKERVRTAVAETTGSPEFERRVARSIIGRDTAPSGAADDWMRAVTNAAAFLRFLADRWLKEAHMYNALKHGLAVQPSPELSFNLVPDGGQGITVARGPALHFIELEASKTEREWRGTTHWIDIPHTLQFVMYAILMINSTWEIGRRFYGHTPKSEQFKSFYPVLHGPEGVKHTTQPLKTSMTFLTEIKVQST